MSLFVYLSIQKERGKEKREGNDKNCDLSFLPSNSIIWSDAEETRADGGRAHCPFISDIAKGPWPAAKVQYG